MALSAPICRRSTLAAAVVCLLLSVGCSVPALATAQPIPDSPTIVDFGSSTIVVQDESLIVSDFHLRGDGLPHLHIGDHSLTIRHFSLDLPHVAVAFGDRTYEFGPISVTVDDVTLGVNDISIGG